MGRQIGRTLNRHDIHTAMRSRDERNALANDVVSRVLGQQGKARQSALLVLRQNHPDAASLKAALQKAGILDGGSVKKIVAEWTAHSR